MMSKVLEIWRPVLGDGAEQLMSYAAEFEARFGRQQNSALPRLRMDAVGAKALLFRAREGLLDAIDLTSNGPSVVIAARSGAGAEEIIVNNLSPWGVGLGMEGSSRIVRPKTPARIDFAQIESIEDNKTVPESLSDLLKSILTDRGYMDKLSVKEARQMEDLGRGVIRNIPMLGYPAGSTAPSRDYLMRVRNILDEELPVPDIALGVVEVGLVDPTDQNQFVFGMLG